MTSPKKTKDVRRFVGMVNYYRDMWHRRAHTLTPLTKLCSTKLKFNWTQTEQKAFEDMKKIVGRDVLLSYPDFSKEFVIHTDASKFQLGAVISQGSKPIAFYLRKLNQAQQNYTMTEKELPSIVETLKEFRTILLGQRIKVYTDHKNLTYTNFTTERVLRWRLLIEEFGPKIIYVKGSKNDVAYALSRLPKTESHVTDSKITREYLAECYGLDKLDSDTFPLNYKLIDKFQQKDHILADKLKRAIYQKETFCGGGKELQLICKNGKIVIPAALQKYVLNWYHTYLLHPGTDCTECTTAKHFF